MRGGVVCPATGLDGPGAVAIAGDRIAAAGPRVDGPAPRGAPAARRPSSCPGLVDLHAHPARGESRYGVDPDLHLLPFGTTTVLAQGEAGALNLARYQDVVIAASLTRVRLAINLVSAGRGDARRLLRGAGGRRRGGLRGGGPAAAAERRARDLGDRGQRQPRDVRAHRPARRHGGGARGRRRDRAPAPVRAPARRRLGARRAARPPPGRATWSRTASATARRASSPAAASGTRSGRPASGASSSTWATGWARSASGWRSRPSRRASSRTPSRRTATSGTSGCRRATTCRGRSPSSSRWA